MTNASPYGRHLPIFPTFYDAPTEDRLERRIERLCDRADDTLKCGQASQAEYDAWYAALDLWARRQRRAA